MTINKKISLALGCVVIAAAMGTAIGQNIRSQQYSYPTPAATASTTTASSAQATVYTLADIALHGNATSCWSAINGGVYDLTAWINQHPGGPQAILSLCGIDGSAAFNDQHGGQSRPANELAGLKIGDVAQ